VILDEKGNPIPNAPKFGQFHIPADVRVKFDASASGGGGQALMWCWRTPLDEVRTYCEGPQGGRRDSTAGGRR
jgi:hypothetical protein